MYVGVNLSRITVFVCNKNGKVSYETQETK